MILAVTQGTNKSAHIHHIVALIYQTTIFQWWCDYFNISVSVLHVLCHGSETYVNVFDHANELYNNTNIYKNYDKPWTHL